MAALLVPAALAQTGAGADAAMMEAPGKYLVFFPWNKATLTEDDQRVVGEAAAEFKRTGSARIDVTGFTDSSGSPAYNLRLSERRADSTRHYQWFPQAARYCRAMRSTNDAEVGCVNGCSTELATA